MEISVVVVVGVGVVGVVVDVDPKNDKKHNFKAANMWDISIVIFLVLLAVLITFKHFTQFN